MEYLLQHALSDDLKNRETLDRSTVRMIILCVAFLLRRHVAITHGSAIDQEAEIGLFQPMHELYMTTCAPRGEEEPIHEVRLGKFTWRDITFQKSVPNG